MKKFFDKLRRWLIRRRSSIWIPGASRRSRWRLLCSIGSSLSPTAA